MPRTFEDLISGCLETGRRFHLLYVYMQLADAPAGDAAQALFPGSDLAGIESVGRILFDAHEPVRPGLTFAAMRENADAHCPDWDIVFILTARNADDSPVGPDQARDYLADMRRRILAGAFPEWAPIFTREGALKALSGAVSVDLAGPDRRAH